jgi:hypothetical protein
MRRYATSNREGRTVVVRLESFFLNRPQEENQMDDWDLLSDEEFGESFGLPQADVARASIERIRSRSSSHEDYSFPDMEIRNKLRSPSSPRPDLYLYSVKIFPPPPSVLSREYFKLIFLPAIQKVLCDTHQLAPDRGWRSEQEFQTEFNAALRHRNCFLNGIVIARKQTEEEAKELVVKLTGVQVSLSDFFSHISFRSEPCSSITES